MGWEAVAVAAVLLAAVAMLVRELAPPAAVLLAAVVVLVLLGVLEPQQGFAGLASPATLTIAGLFVISRAVRDHARVSSAIGAVLDGRRRRAGGGPPGERGAVLRLTGLSAALSAVLNNTTVVTTAAPVVRTWAERRGLPTSRLLMPLSFAAIVGGATTTIGTSTTLLVSGQLEQAGRAGLDLFTVTWVGLPVAVAAVGLMTWLVPRLLPDRRSPHERLGADERDFSVRLRVADGGPLDRVTVEDAGLRELATTYLVALIRDGHEIAPVPPDTLLLRGDALAFVGRVDDVRDLLQRPGLEPEEGEQARLLDGDGHELYECVLGTSSRLVGRTLKEVSFRGHYGGAVVAIHRAGERIDAKLGAVRLQPGDGLLVLADPLFDERWQGARDFAVVVPHRDRAGEAGPRERLVLAVLAAAVLAAAVGLLPIVHAVLAACLALLGTRTIGFRRALDSLDLDVLLLVAAAIGLGEAMQVSGLADGLADAVVAVSGVGGPLVALAALVVGTLVMTELVTNVAAAGLLLPVALRVSEQVPIEAHGLAVAVAVAASASFLTPIGYQTNTIVYGLGGYRFGDYWRLGLPLTLTVLVVTLAVVPVVWG